MVAGLHSPPAQNVPREALLCTSQIAAQMSGSGGGEDLVLSAEVQGFKRRFYKRWFGHLRWLSTRQSVQWLWRTKYFLVEQVVISFLTSTQKSPRRGKVIRLGKWELVTLTEFSWTYRPGLLHYITICQSTNQWEIKLKDRKIIQNGTDFSVAQHVHLSWC